MSAGKRHLEITAVGTDRIFTQVEPLLAQVPIFEFPLEPYIKLGFHRFKLLRARTGSITGI